MEKSWREVTKSTGNLQVSQIERILDNRESVVSLPGQIIAFRHGDFIGLYPKPPEGLDVSVKVPGRTHVPELGLSVETRIIKNPKGDKRPMEHIKGHTESGSFFMVELKAWADYNMCDGEMRIRTRLPGDRFAPLGMRGKGKKVKDLLISMRVPRYYRDFIPIFTLNTSIVWVGGYRLSEQFKIGPETEEILEIEIQPSLRQRQNCATI